MSIFKSSSGGFSLVEVLVTIVIASFGLLGLASMLMRGIQANNSSLLRSIAVQQTYDMADRMRANATAIAGGSFDNVTYAADQECSGCSSSSSCSSTQLATYDICMWNSQNESLLPSGQGTVSKSGNVYTITVSWDDTRSGNANTNFSVKVDP